MEVINLESLEGLPNKYFERLNSFRQEFLDFESLDELEENYGIQELIYDIDQFCSENSIIGFHFTRADPNNILEKGLLSRTGQEIRDDFLFKYGNEFNPEEITEIKNAWANEFDDSDKKVRDNRVYFNFTKDGLKNHGADLLLNNLGGEQVFWPLHQRPKLQRKIQKLGVPLILKCTLNPNDIKTYIENRWGKIVMSSFHRTINSNAFQTDQDGYQKKSVQSECIEIIEWKKNIC